MMVRMHGLVERLFREPMRVTTSAPASDVDPRHAAAVVDPALRAAEMAIQTGAVTSDATSFAVTVTSAYGLAVDVDVTFTSITVSYHRRGKAEPITGFRGVRQRGTTYTQLTQLLRPYRVWVITLGQALTGVGVAAILGGRPGEMVLVGFTITLWAGLKLGVQGCIAPTGGYANPSALQIVWAIVIAMGLAFGFQLGLRRLPFVALLAQFIVGRYRIPLIALVTAGVVALMPGSALYRGLYELIRTVDAPISVQAQISPGNAMMVALGLSAGSTFGAQIASPVGLPSAKLFRVAELRTLRRSRRSTTSTEVSR